MAPPLSARKTAWLVLNQCDILRQDAAERLHQYLPQSDRPAQATDIVFGVIRNQTALDTVIARCAAVTAAHVKPSIWNLLRIGTYELVYAPKTADYAILNEAVERAGEKGSKKTAGFVNAVLRAVQKNIQSRQADRTGSDPRKTLPQTAETGCVFHGEVLADPVTEPAAALAGAFSLPIWLVADWLDAYGRDRTEAICLACNRHPSVLLQPHTLRITAEELCRRLTDRGLDCQVDPARTMCRLTQAGNISEIDEFSDGLFLVQDAAAATAMNVLDARPGWTIADLCAAPGGKSIALALQMQDRGRILATDSDPKRLQKVRQNVQRMKLSAIETVPAEQLDAVLRRCASLEAIVLDVPCSNTGVLARRVEARHRLRQRDITGLLATQQRLLADAAARCQQHTQIVYSTCSIQPQENSQQIRTFLSQHGEFILKTEKLTLPALKTDTLFDHDGGYVAVMQHI